MSGKDLVELADLEQVIERHWQTHRPAMYTALQEQGELEGAIRQAAENTRGAVRQLVDEQGMPFLYAWETVREMWAILPAEEGAGLDDAPGDPALVELMDAIVGAGDDDGEFWDAEDF
jgi:hypothetical protein